MIFSCSYFYFWGYFTDKFLSLWIVLLSCISHQKFPLPFTIFQTLVISPVCLVFMYFSVEFRAKIMWNSVLIICWKYLIYSH